MRPPTIVGGNALQTITTYVNSAASMRPPTIVGGNATIR